MMKQEVKETLGYIINGISIAVYFFLLFAIGDPLGCPYFEYIGWILLGLGIFLILVSSYTLIRNRGKGLIDWGIYGIVRHPMYVGAILIFLSWAFLLPHWLTLLLTLTNIAIIYWFILQGDRRNIELFGGEYEQYIESVPRVNILAGFLKSLKKG
jgi:protein-S-isoprenylcysteine O-methyltransferase Ste14